MRMFLGCSGLIQKRTTKRIVFPAVGIILLVLMFQNFTTNLLLKSKTLNLEIFAKY